MYSIQMITSGWTETPACLVKPAPSRTPVMRGRGPRHDDGFHEERLEFVYLCSLAHILMCICHYIYMLCFAAMYVRAQVLAGGLT